MTVPALFSCSLVLERGEKRSGAGVALGPAPPSAALLRAVLPAVLPEWTLEALVASGTCWTLAFVLYHVPYAYPNPHWPSAGNLPHAFWLATVNGTMGGVILGLVYVKSGRNLMSVILLHAMVDWVPGTIMVSQVKFGGG